MRSWNSSWTSCSVKSVTSQPARPRGWTSPSASSRCNASRTGVRLTCSCSASCRSTRVCRGASSPLTIAARIASYVRSPSWTAGMGRMATPPYPSPVVGRGHAADALPHLVARVERVPVERWAVDGLEVGDELFMARRPEQDAADERAPEDPPQGELDEREAGLLRDTAQSLDRGELHRIPVTVPVHPLREPGSGRRLVPGPMVFAGQQPACERVVGEHAPAEVLRAGGVLRLHAAA